MAPLVPGTPSLQKTGTKNLPIDTMDTARPRYDDRKGRGGVSVHFVICDVKKNPPGGGFFCGSLF